MSKANERRTERLQRMQAEAKARERNRRLAMAGAAVAVVVIIVVVIVVVKVAGGGNSTSNQTPVSQKGLAQVVRDVTNVPLKTLNAVGAGSAIGPKPVSGATALTANGKPKVLYIGGEFCPYCAATRWGLAVALSRFGTLSGLGETRSESDDVYPNTNTLTFVHAKYTSDYLVFAPYETLDRNKQPLETPPSDDEAVFQKYDSPPYVSEENQGSIPFIDIAGKYFLYGAPYNPQTLAGLSHQQIAAALKNPSSPVAQGVDGSANIFTAAFCKATGQQPASVCTQPGVKTAAAKLGGS